MTRDQVRVLLRRHQDALNRHDVATLVSLYADDALIVSPMFDTVRGGPAIRRSFERLFDIFPDYSIEMEEALFLCEGARAAEFSTVTGTHQVEIFGLPPTGHRIEYRAARLFTVDADHIQFEQRIYDFRGVLERLEKTRLERELAIASAVQHTLLGRTHHTGPFFQIVGSSLPCRTIGGDFIENLDLPSGALGLAVGDVSGKGPPAALVAAMLQGMFSIVAGESPDPSTALDRINRALCRRGIEPRFATLAYGTLDAAGHFTYANAGHNPPLLLSARGVTRLTAGGPMLGVFEHAGFPQETLVLDPGDTILAFSDGLTDAVAPDGTPFGLDRLIACAGAAPSLAPAALLDHIFDTIRGFTRGEPPVDDVTVTIVRFR